MSEVYKITNMLVTDEDIKHIDKNWQSIIDEYVKTTVREKDLVIAQYLMKKQKDEIERLNNIINELEEWLYDNTNYEEYDRVEKDTFNYVIKKIEELRNEEK